MSEADPEVRIFTDIDQTLSALIAPFLAWCRTELSLPKSALPKEVLLKLHHEEMSSDPHRDQSFSGQFFKYVPNVDRDAFLQARERIRREESLHRGLPALPDALAGTWLLYDQFGFIGYLTSRPVEIEGATKEWLSAKRTYKEEKRPFPQNDNVIFCPDSKNKLETLLEYIDGSEDKKKMVLIDNDIKSLIISFIQIINEDPSRLDDLQHVILVAFGINEDRLRQIIQGLYLDPEISPSLVNLLENTSILKVFTLPSWQSENVKKLIRIIKDITI